MTPCRRLRRRQQGTCFPLLVAFGDRAARATAAPIGAASMGSRRIVRARRRTCCASFAESGASLARTTTKEGRGPLLRRRTQPAASSGRRNRQGCSAASPNPMEGPRLAAVLAITAARAARAEDFSGDFAGSWGSARARRVPGVPVAQGFRAGTTHVGCCPRAARAVDCHPAGAQTRTLGGSQPRTLALIAQAFLAVHDNAEASTTGIRPQLPRRRRRRLRLPQRSGTRQPVAPSETRSR